MVRHWQRELQEGDKKVVIRAGAAGGNDVGDGERHLVILERDIGFGDAGARFDVVALEAGGSFGTVAGGVRTELVTQVGDSGDAVIGKVYMEG